MSDELPVGKIIIGALVVTGLIIGSGMYGCPQYNVYNQRMAGEAELAQAQYTRQTKVVEAQANYESAMLNMKSRIVDAKGVAEANKIIASGLGGPEGYLRFEYIQMLKESKDKQVVYIPTEAGLPILEAGKR